MSHSFNEQKVINLVDEVIHQDIKDPFWDKTELTSVLYNTLKKHKESHIHVKSALINLIPEIQTHLDEVLYYLPNNPHFGGMYKEDQPPQPLPKDHHLSRLVPELVSPNQ